jgi:hypothetical protein
MAPPAHCTGELFREQKNMGQASLAVGTPVTRRPLHLLKRMYPGVFDPRYAVNPSLEARLRHPCRRRPRIEHTGAPQITVVA